MSQEALNYPFTLERPAIQALLPHRGDIFVCQRLVIQGPHVFHGTARWPVENVLIQSHFPGLPVVPGAFLIEATAQLAGAGLLAGDSYVKGLTGDLIGVIAAVRKCTFKQPVAAGEDVEFAIQCRQMAPMAVQIGATVRARAAEVAQLDILMVYTFRDQLISGLSA
jgi:3-hydroxyacyl-[acyl-carrier-protein] dehydratase